MDAVQTLATRIPRFDVLVGIDSDGCVFDSMEMKQKQVFHPLIVKTWDLQPVETAVRETAEFVNLHSVYRGSNRFPALLKTFGFLASRRDVAAAGVSLPDMADLRAFVESGAPLSNETLRVEADRTGSETLRRALRWSRDVNRRIRQDLPPAPVFPEVRESLKAIRRCADAVVVSQTPAEALLHEWTHHGLADRVDVIAGQECGSKAEQLTLAMQGRLPPERVLLLGDAPGDARAADAVGACFQPILPGREPDSWRIFREEGLARFLDGTFAGAYQREQIRAFEELLPATPPWDNEEM